MFSKNINIFSKNKTRFSITNYQKPACSKKSVKKVFGITKHNDAKMNKTKRGKRANYKTSNNSLIFLLLFLFK